MRRRAYLYIFVLALLFAVAPVRTALAAKAAVSRVSLAERSDGRGYVLRIHTTDVVKAFSAPRKTGNGAYEVTLFNTSLSSDYQSTVLPAPLASHELFTRQDNLILRFSVSGPFTVSVYRDRDTSDLLVGLERSSADVAEELKPKGPSQDARDRWLLDTIVIDAGHGGRDPGTMGNGYKEKDITLAVALKLGAYLENELGVNVVYTRKDDRSVDVKERGKIANEAGAKLFVSIHVNAQVRGRNAYGAETYLLGMHKTTAAREVMERENAVINLESNPELYQDYTQDGLIRLALAQSAYMRQSEQLADRIQYEFEHHVSRHNRGVKQAGFLVLWTASMPSVLIELGFITNRKEAKFLGSETGQTYMASAIFRAIRDFRIEYQRSLEGQIGD